MELRHPDESFGEKIAELGDLNTCPQYRTAGAIDKLDQRIFEALSDGRTAALNHALSCCKHRETRLLVEEKIAHMSEELQVKVDASRELQNISLFAITCIIPVASRRDKTYEIDPGPFEGLAKDLFPLSGDTEVHVSSTLVPLRTLIGLSPYQLFRVSMELSRGIDERLLFLMNKGTSNIVPPWLNNFGPVFAVIGAATRPASQNHPEYPFSGQEGPAKDEVFRKVTSILKGAFKAPGSKHLFWDSATRASDRTVATIGSWAVADTMKKIAKKEKFLGFRYLFRSETDMPEGLTVSVASHDSKPFQSLFAFPNECFLRPVRPVELRDTIVRNVRSALPENNTSVYTLRRNVFPSLKKGRPASKLITGEPPRVHQRREAFMIKGMHAVRYAEQAFSQLPYETARALTKREKGSKNQYVDLTGIEAPSHELEKLREMIKANVIAKDDAAIFSALNMAKSESSYALLENIVSEASDADTHDDGLAELFCVPVLFFTEEDKFAPRSVGTTEAIEHSLKSIAHADENCSITVSKHIYSAVELRFLPYSRRLELMQKILSGDRLDMQVKQLPGKSSGIEKGLFYLVGVAKRRDSSSFSPLDYGPELGSEWPSHIEDLLFEEHECPCLARPPKRLAYGLKDGLETAKWQNLSAICLKIKNKQAGKVDFVFSFHRREHEASPWMRITVLLDEKTERRINWPIQKFTDIKQELARIKVIMSSLLIGRDLGFHKIPHVLPPDVCPFCGRSHHVEDYLYPVENDVQI